MLSLVGVLFLAASIGLRLLDQPEEYRTFDPSTTGVVSDGDVEGLFSRSFGVAADPGTVTGLRCALNCPVTLSVKLDQSSPGTVAVRVRAGLMGTQTGKTNARLMVIAPHDSDHFTLEEHSHPGVRLKVAPLDAVSADVGRPNAAIVTFTEIFPRPGVTFELDFQWHPGSSGGWKESFFGRRNLGIPYFTGDRIWFDPPTVSLRPGNGLDASLSRVNLDASVTPQSRIGNALPDPDRKPLPRTVRWSVPGEQAAAFYFVTAEERRKRTLFGLINEQVLFFAGLLLGAWLGEIASQWRKS
ncbi:hypothetical protein ACTFTM_20605 [Micromonospora sp. RB23]